MTPRVRLRSLKVLNVIVYTVYTLTLMKLENKYLSFYIRIALNIKVHSTVINVVLTYS